MRRSLRQSPLLILLATGLACSSKLVKKEDIRRISKDYEGVYALKDKIDVGNFDSLNKGAKVKLYFKATGEYVSIQAYPYSQPREEAVGKNILQLFEGDFPNKKFSEEVLRARIAELVEEYKGKLEAAPASKGFGADLNKGSAPPPSKESNSGSGGRGRGRR